MRAKRLVVIGLVATLCTVPAAAALATGSNEPDHTPTLVQQVRDATRGFQDVNDATAAGYASLGSCVSGPTEGAMGIHYGKDALVGDGEVHADQPELLLYEQRGGERRLLGWWSTSWSRTPGRRRGTPPRPCSSASPSSS